MRTISGRPISPSLPACAVAAQRLPSLVRPPRSIPKHRRTLEFPSTFRKNFLLHSTNPSRTSIVVTPVLLVYMSLLFPPGPTPRRHPSLHPLYTPAIPLAAPHLASPATVRRSLRPEYVLRTQTTTRLIHITHPPSPNILTRPPRPPKRGTMVTPRIDSSLHVLSSRPLYSLVVTLLVPKQTIMCTRMRIHFQVILYTIPFSYNF